MYGCVNGGVQKAAAQVSLYKFHTTEEPLRRRRSDRNCQVLSGHSDQVEKLLLMLSTSKSMDSVLIPKSSSKSLRCLTCPSESFTSP
jgi:hypothetical protein